MLTRISKELHRKRIEKVREHLVSTGADYFLIFNALSNFYLTGFHHISTERPIALIISGDKELLFIPALEVDHVQEKLPWLEFESYFEYPDFEHPMKHLIKILGKPEAIIADSPGAQARWGYEGPKLEDLLKNTKITIESDFIQDMRVIKDDEELNLIRESAKWGNLAHKLLQEYTQVGLGEIEVSNAASLEASLAMVNALGPDFDPVGGLAHAGYRGQIGKSSAIPHSLTRNLKFKKGDVLVTGASSNVGGYLSELERTFIMGEPTEKQEKMFNIMLEAQTASLEAFGPGVKCSEVDNASRAVFEKHGVIKLVSHHTGHAIGLEGHEKPFLDRGLDLEMKPGMVFTCEPGIYEVDYAGFRHSDTIIITENGSEMVTYYPRDLESLIIE